MKINSIDVSNTYEKNIQTKIEGESTNLIFYALNFAKKYDNINLSLN